MYTSVWGIIITLILLAILLLANIVVYYYLRGGRLINTNLSITMWILNLFFIFVILGVILWSIIDLIVKYIHRNKEIPRTRQNIQGQQSVAPVPTRQPYNIPPETRTLSTSLENNEETEILKRIVAGATY